MPTELRQRFDVTWRGKPPHMLEQDHPVWFRFLDKYGPYFINLWYDCLVGGPFLTPDQEKDPFQRMWRGNTAKRIDAIAELPDEVWIIEVADYPGLRSLGQLQVYQALWIEDPKIAKPEKMILVASRIDNDLGAACGRFGVQVYLV